ncbi:MAG: anthranilate phosphoribosyltransferase [Deltaproteobacteria bacterium]|jgi:anthranilate synthase/phosphoribosyltransferase|nr:anthranilate phosphoribosyltransferase [Deltaproteobacteria bacterium]
MLLLIDNYDSFTYNLAQAFQTLGVEPVVVRNDSPGLMSYCDSPDLELVCLSPGPGRPSEAGLCADFLKSLKSRGRDLPVLGVCLGHQVLAGLAGFPVVRAGRVMHGRTSPVEHDGGVLFRGLPPLFQAGRYHSLLAVEPDGAAEPAAKPLAKVTARTPEGEIMGISFLDDNWHGVQFHPESVLTPDGRDILANFLALAAPGASAKASPAAAGTAGPARASAPQPVPVETPRPLPAIFESLGRGEDLDEETALRVFERLMDGELSAAQAGGLLMGLRTKGETAVEVAAAARAVLNRAADVDPGEGPALDVVGTGGDNRFSFNCSTGTALTCAALGHRVLKHGNRSVSSRSGSADVLERLGYKIELTPEELSSRMRRENFVFLYAPQHHPSFRHIMPVRRELGVRTLFNILGPLVNPARPTHRLVGVYQPQLLDLMAGALARLGGVRAAVVHGAGGYDELTPIGPAEARMVEGGRVTSLTLDPADFGFSPCSPEDLAIADPAEGALVLRELLNGRGPAPMRDMLVFNVGLALLLLKGGAVGDRMGEAREAVLSGAAGRTLPEAPR